MTKAGMVILYIVVQLQLHILYTHFISISLFLFYYWKSHWLHALFYYTEREREKFSICVEWTIAHNWWVWTLKHHMDQYSGVFPLIIIATKIKISYSWCALTWKSCFQTKWQIFFFFVPLLSITMAKTGANLICSSYLLNFVRAWPHNG